MWWFIIFKWFDIKQRYYDIVTPAQAVSSHEMVQAESQYSQPFIQSECGIQSALIIMKLSQIAIHHADNHTDRLYQPLRKAIHTYSPQPIYNQIANQQPIHSDVRKSKLHVVPLQPNLMKETTLIPQNMRLVQTNNPLKRFKARSRSYRAISVQQRVGTPLKTITIQQNIAAKKATSKKEIVYDYQPGQYQQRMQHNSTAMTVNQMRSGEYRLPARTRSATLLLPASQTLANRPQRVQSKTATMQTKQSQQISNPSTKASLQLQQQPTINNKNAKNSNRRSSKQIELSSDYYQDCRRYTFDRRMKQREQSASGAQLRPRNGSYKYNLFSMMDQQANTKCASGLCTNNQLITPKIKQRW